jgi:hypothetical protein
MEFTSQCETIEGVEDCTYVFPDDTPLQVGDVFTSVTLSVLLFFTILFGILDYFDDKMWKAKVAKWREEGLL